MLELLLCLAVRMELVGCGLRCLLLIDLGIVFDVGKPHGMDDKLNKIRENNTNLLFFIIIFLIISLGWWGLGAALRYFTCNFVNY